MPAKVLTDIEIAQSSPIKHIRDIAATVGINKEELEYYGKYKAKLPLSIIDEEKIKQHHLVLVTAITPTPLGEGKTTVAIGLTEGLNRIGKKTIAVLREPSLGPVFGVKGGAAGGGYSQVIPMEDINLHFTGDFSAIEKANNLLAALIDNNLQSKTRSLNLDPRTIVWKRVMDMNDRALRNIIVGLGGTQNGIPREDGFNITPASEVMAILCMSKDMNDLKQRLGNIFIGMTFDQRPVFARDLHAVGAMTVLLKDAIKPNLVQTLEGNAAILHGGPFASIAQGTNSVLATKMGLTLGEFVVTEAGFGADLGAEKFFDIKCVSSGLVPEAVVLVVTVKALRYHGGAKKEEWMMPSLAYVEKGLPNLRKHLENLQLFGMRPVVAVNHFSSDDDAELKLIQQYCNSMGIQAVVVRAWAGGGKGCEELAQQVAASVARKESRFHSLYNWELSVEEKIHIIATKIYGADGVEYSTRAKTQLKKIPSLGFENFPVCMAKTPRSFSDDENKRGRPENFSITVREFEYAGGAGFVIPVLGDMMRMPGLPSIPSAENIDIDEDGKITGLF
jgi:formate--tetrahydrofolate ligase